MARPGISTKNTEKIRPGLKFWTNWDLSLGQTGLVLFNSTVKPPVCPVCPWDGWGFVLIGFVLLRPPPQN